MRSDGAYSSGSQAGSRGETGNVRPSLEPWNHTHRRRRKVPMIPTALTIAGSDPSGGAGIQADLKTFSALRVYGMAVVAALTVQNTKGVFGVSEVSPSHVAEQIDAVVSDIPPEAVNTGMLMSAANVAIV